MTCSTCAHAKPAEDARMRAAGWLECALRKPRDLGAQYHSPFFSCPARPERWVAK